MGLPVFREPEDEQATAVADKIDRTTSASRRTIRRQPTLRPYRERAIRGSSHGSSSEDLEDTSLRQQSVRYQPRFSRIDFPLGRSPGPDDLYAMRDELMREEERSQAGEELLLDALRYERPGQRLRRPRRQRESALRFELAPSPPSIPSPPLFPPRREPQSTEGPSEREQIPTPPYSSSGNGPERQSPENGSSITPPLTVGFAPAFPVNSEHQNDDDSDRMSTGSNLLRIPTPPMWPPLHRTRATVQRQSHRRSSGDRSDSDLEEGTWDTLLTTLEPDEHLPSASSSFASATASLSTSESAPASQSTAPSSIDTMRATEASTNSAYCPLSPSGSGDESSENDDDDDRAPAPPQALIRRMNRRAAVAASRPHRHPGPYSHFAHGVWTDDYGEMRRRLSPFGMIGYERMEPHTDSQEGHVHLPVILDGSLRASPRPVDGPADDGSDFSQRVLSINAVSSSRALDQEIRDERAREDEQRRERRRELRRMTRDRQQRRRQEGRESQGLEDLQALRRNVFGSLDAATATADDLEAMRQVIERMARREDIPDEWWAAVGLQRSL